MRSSIRLSTLSMTLAAMLALPVAALAQNPAAPTAPKRHSGMMHGHAMSMSMSERVAQRITELHAQLHITKDQQPQWDAFAQVMRDNAQHMQQTAEDRAEKIKAMNASENMLSYAQIATQHAQDLQTLASAFQPLYALLSQDQQRLADTLFRDSGMRHARGHHQG